MFKDKKFLESMSKHDKEDMENYNKPILEVEEPEDESPESAVRKRRNSEQINDHVQVMTPQPLHQVESNGSNGNGFHNFGSFTSSQNSRFLGRAGNLPPLKLNGRANSISTNNESRSPLRSSLRTGSTLVGAEMVQAHRKIKISTNISMLVRRYANFLFEEENLNINKDRLNVEQFSKLIQGHEKIFASYFEGFHNYIWEVESPEGIPEFITNTSWVRDSCLEID